MPKRFVSIWFRHLTTDWFTLRQPDLRGLPFVLAKPDHGRMVVSAVNALAEAQGINTGMAVADARAIIPSLKVLDDRPDLSGKLLKDIAEWFIRYTPIVSIDADDGLILDATGCAHLWGGEEAYLEHIVTRLKNSGYEVRAAMADTIGTAWAISHFGRSVFIIRNNEQTTALLSLPPEALRLDVESIELLPGAS